MNDDLTLLASAYLDGDVTADERARAEGDPEVVAEIERLRTVRALLSDLETPAISVRESHLATALGVWERLPETERRGVRRDQTPAGVDAAAVAGAASVTAPTPLNTRRRPASTRWLTGAAAALVLVLAGGVALQLSGGNDQDDSADATDEIADETSTASADDDSAARAGGDLGADELAPAATSADDAANQLDTGIDDGPPPPEQGGLPQLLDTTDLADFAGVAVGAPLAPDDAPDATSAVGDLSEAAAEIAEAEPRCLGVDVVVGPAVYVDTPVVVGIDESRNLALAYEPLSCTEVARVRLP